MCIKAASRELMGVTDLSFLTIRWGGFSAWGHQCPEGWKKGKAHHKPIQTQSSIQQL